jgi:hypothetical protein
MLDSVHSVSNTVVSIIVSLNLVTLVSLIGGASSAYLATDSGFKSTATDVSHAAVRLQLFRLCTWCLSIIASIKIMLPTDFADSIISAWFIGQGFALQSILTSVIHGIVLRYSKTVRTGIIERTGSIRLKGNDYTVQDANIAFVTLVHTASKPATGAQTTRIVLWTELYSVDIKRKDA